MLHTTVHNRFARSAPADAFTHRPRFFAFVQRLVGSRPTPPSARAVRPYPAAGSSVPEAIGATDADLARLNRRLARYHAVEEVRWQVMAIQYGASRRQP